MKKVGIALLGLGTVGGGTYKILEKNHEAFKKYEGLDIEVLHVLERNMKRVEELGVNPDIVSTDIDNVVNNKDISIVCEFFGGIEPARTFLIKALEAGKSIVTANKELFSKHWHELEAAAKRGKAGLYFEASCVGGVPIIRTITEGMQANTILSIKGIINGTTNYILSAMSENGTSYEDALKSAQELGYAEFDPTADVEGFDASYKLSILSTLSYHKKVPVQRVYREGITQISVDDINTGKKLGYTLKLLATAKTTTEKSRRACILRSLKAAIRLRRCRAVSTPYTLSATASAILCFTAGARAICPPAAQSSAILFMRRISANHAIYRSKTTVQVAIRTLSPILRASITSVYAPPTAKEFWAEFQPFSAKTKSVSKRFFRTKKTSIQRRTLSSSRT